MSRSTMIIIAVVAVAGIASGLAYTAMVINSDNSSSAEYGLVSFVQTADHSQTATASEIFSSSGCTLKYEDETVSGKLYFSFTLTSLDAQHVKDWRSDGDILCIKLGDQTYTGEFSSDDQTSITVVSDVVDLTYGSNDAMYKAFRIYVSDGSNLTASCFSDSQYHLTVQSHHLEEMA